MTFDESIKALESLAAEGVTVTATVCGTGPEADPLMSQTGLLRRLGSGDEVDEPAGLYPALTPSRSFVLAVTTGGKVRGWGSDGYARRRHLGRPGRRRAG